MSADPTASTKQFSLAAKALAERKRVIRVMEREAICSEHGARCYIEAIRRDNARLRKLKGRGRG